jgi:hypothetical protein
VEADTQRGVFPGERYGLVCRVSIHHQACGGEDAFAMGFNNRVINAGRSAEIVGIDD